MKITPPESLHIDVRLAGDKSLSHRALIWGALRDGGTRILNLSRGADVQSTASALRELGVMIKRDPNDVVTVEGAITPQAGEIDCGNSGTTARVLIGLLSAIEGMEVTLSGDASLSQRPMARVVEPLRQMGAKIEYLGEDGRLPLMVRGCSLTGMHHDLEVASAQVKSALLLAGLNAEREVTVSEPHPSRDHTEIALRTGFAPHYDLPGDISSAAFLLALTILHREGACTLPRVLSNPTRMGFVNAATTMGASISIGEEGSDNGEAFATLRAKTSELEALRLSAEEVPACIDEIPLLALLATQADGESRLSGLQELRVKESDRLAETQRILAGFGADISIKGDDLIVRGPTPLRGCKINAGDDHRMVMLAMLCALIAEGESEIAGADAVAISYPDFFTDLGINL